MLLLLLTLTHIREPTILSTPRKTHWAIKPIQKLPKHFIIKATILWFQVSIVLTPITRGKSFQDKNLFFTGLFKYRMYKIISTQKDNDFFFLVIIVLVIFVFVVADEICNLMITNSLKTYFLIYINIFSIYL